MCCAEDAEAPHMNTHWRVQRAHHCPLKPPPARRDAWSNLRCRATPSWGGTSISRTSHANPTEPQRREPPIAVAGKPLQPGEGAVT